MSRTRFRFAVALIAALFAVSCGGSDSQKNAPPPGTSEQASSAKNADTDTSLAPGQEAEVATPEGARTAFNLRSSQVRTRHVFDAAITAGKIALVATTINVAATSATASSAANPDLVGGVLISCDPSGNQDQHLDNAVLNGDGSITITLGAAATAQNNFRCITFKANAKGIS